MSIIDATDREERDPPPSRPSRTSQISRFPGSAVALAELADGAREYVAASLAPATRAAQPERSDGHLRSVQRVDPRLRQVSPNARSTEPFRPGDRGSRSPRPDRPGRPAGAGNAHDAARAACSCAHPGEGPGRRGGQSTGWK
jgi:hypothetical protein